jgi:hypothetical protein
MSARVEPAGSPSPARADAQDIVVRRLDGDGEAQWTEFLKCRPEANLYHSLQWRDIVAECFDHQPVYLVASRDGLPCAILPLFLIRNKVLGSKLLSLPYDICSGGALAVDTESERAICEHAIAAARSLRVQFLEFRSDHPRPVLDDLALTRSEPVVISEMVLDGDSAVWKRVSADHMKGLRKARNRGVEVRLAASREDYADFYRVYLQVFRAFGTPPYGARYFDLLYEKLHPAGHVKLFLALVDGRCVGGLQLFCWERNLVSKFAACLPEAVPRRAYAALYGAAIEFGLQNRYTRLNWGSSARSQRGLIEFKEGWGAQSHPSVRYALPVCGSVPDVSRYYDEDGIQKRVWRRLPLSWTRVMGHPLNRWFC